MGRARAHRKPRDGVRRASGGETVPIPGSTAHPYGGLSSLVAGLRYEAMPHGAAPGTGADANEGGMRMVEPPGRMPRQPKLHRWKDATRSQEKDGFDKPAPCH